MAQMEHKTFGKSGSVQEPIARQENNPENELRSLIEVGCITDRISLGGKIFELKTLGSNVRMSLAQTLNEKPTKEELYDFNLRTLSCAVQTVNGKRLEYFHPDYNEGTAQKDVELMRFEIVTYFQSPVIGELLRLYNEMTEKSDGQYEIDEVKK